MEYAVIRVYEFEELPVICKKDSNDTKTQIIYYRNKNRRIESAAISNSNDLRDLILLATRKMLMMIQVIIMLQV